MPRLITFRSLISNEHFRPFHVRVSPSVWIYLQNGGFCLMRLRVSENILHITYICIFTLTKSFNQGIYTRKKSFRDYCFYQCLLNGWFYRTLLLPQLNDLCINKTSFDVKSFYTPVSCLILLNISFDMKQIKSSFCNCSLILSSTFQIK